MTAPSSTAFHCGNKAAVLLVAAHVHHKESWVGALGKLPTLHPVTATFEQVMSQTNGVSDNKKSHNDTPFFTLFVVELSFFTH